MDKKKYLGFGLGLKTKHYSAIHDEKPKVDWFEALTENYLVPGGKPLYHLMKIRESYPMTMHGVSLSIGSVDPLDFNYLKQVKTLAEALQPEWISDHLCWTGVNQLNTHDLLPLPYTEEALNHVAERVMRVQDFLGRQILLENVSSYITFNESTLTEWDFLKAITERADCLILLDVNNIYVSSVNHEFNPLDYLNAIPAKRVQQIHLAGHLNRGDYIIDTHDHDIIDPVWNLYRETLKRMGKVSTMIERDDHIPPLAELLDELAIARNIESEVFSSEKVDEAVS